jgi:hypothetical protein
MPLASVFCRKAVFCMKSMLFVHFVTEAPARLPRLSLMPPTPSTNVSLAQPDALGSQAVQVSNASSGRERSGAAGLLLVVVLAVHAALMVGEVLPGPTWLAALEAVVALLVGLIQLRRVAEQEDQP